MQNNLRITIVSYIFATENIINHNKHTNYDYENSFRFQYRMV